MLLAAVGVEEPEAEVAGVAAGEEEGVVVVVVIAATMEVAVVEVL